MEFKVFKEKLNLEKIQEIIGDGLAGGECYFVGTVRNETKGRKVKKLFFEAYEPMAISEMEKIGERALEKFDIIDVAIHHRVGNLTVGEIPVIIGVSSKHRKASFEACEYCIDELKKSVPIWKKEFFEDGAIWVSAFP